MTPFTDHQEMPRLFHEAIIYRQLLAMGLQAHDVYFPQAGGAQCCIIQVEPRHDGQVTDALLSVLGAPFLNMKMAIAVDPDIDIYDYRDIQYALAFRSHRSTGAGSRSRNRSDSLPQRGRKMGA
jgi:UbiD family decarboxylase